MGRLHHNGRHFFAASCGVDRGHAQASSDCGGSDDRHTSQQLGQQAVNGVDIILVNVDFENLFQVGDRRACGHAPFLVTDPFRIGMLRAIMFVFQFAHNLLDGIFDGDHARDSAIFIHHNGDMLACALHLVEKIVDRLGFRHEHGVTNYRFDFACHRRMVEGRRAHGIFQISHADQIVHIVADDRHT